jgi:hypothetical protein
MEKGKITTDDCVARCPGVSDDDHVAIGVSGAEQQPLS